MFSPTENDRERLEVVHEHLQELSEKEGTPEFYVFKHNSDALQLGIRLQGLEAKSELARRGNLDPAFAKMVIELNELCDSPEDIVDVIEAVELLGSMRYPSQGESAAKEKIHSS